MILNDKAVTIIRTAMAECEKAIGTEYADVYTAKLLGRLETVLELAGDEKQGWTISVPTPYTAVNAVQEPVNLDDDVEEMAEDEQDPPRRKRMDVDHDEIRKMLSEGVTVNEISERTGAHISTIYKIKKMQRDMEAK